MAHATDALNEQITATLQAFEKSGAVQDTIFSGDPLLALLESKGKKVVKGGDPIRVNLRYGTNENVMSYFGAETLDTGEIDTTGHADFSWKQYSVGFSVPEIEMLTNTAGPAQIIDLWKEKVENSTLSLKDKMLDGIYGDGTGNSGKDILGLKAILSDTGVLGGIDRALAAWWRAQVRDFSLDAQRKPTIARIKSMIRTIRGPEGRPEKSGKVDMLLCNQDLYDYIEGLVDDKHMGQVVSGTVASLGFDTIRIAGAELTWSERVPAGEIWYISTEYLGIRVLPGRDFAFENVGRTLVNNQDARKAFILWAGQLVPSNCRYLGRDTGYSLA